MNEELKKYKQKIDKEGIYISPDNVFSATPLAILLKKNYSKLILDRSSYLKTMKTIVRELDELYQNNPNTDIGKTFSFVVLDAIEEASGGRPLEAISKASHARIVKKALDILIEFSPVRQLYLDNDKYVFAMGRERGLKNNQLLN